MEKLLTVVIPAYNAEKYITYTWIHCAQGAETGI